MIKKTFSIEVQDRDNGVMLFVPIKGGVEDRKNIFTIPLGDTNEYICDLLYDLAKSIVGEHIMDAEHLQKKLQKD